MVRNGLIAVLVVAALALAACAPTITVENRTQIPVRVVVRAGGKTQTVSPSPGESSTAEVQTGAYRVTVIPEAEWIDYAKNVRKFLNDQLANSDSLSGPQLLEVIRRLKDVAARMQQFEQAAGTTGSCGGTLNEDKSDAVATVNIGITGALAVTCK